PGYRLVKKLGEGGMGEVFLAKQLGLRRPVAIKLLSAHSSGQLTGFKRESRLVGSLAHAHVVRILDSGETDGSPFLVLEYVPGSSLRALLKPGRPWPAARAFPILHAVAQGLSHLHAQGILHLDLKPENVLIGKRGEIKITD